MTGDITAHSYRRFTPRWTVASSGAIGRQRAPLRTTPLRGIITLKNALKNGHCQLTGSRIMMAGPSSPVSRPFSRGCSRRQFPIFAAAVVSGLYIAYC